MERISCLMSIKNNYEKLTSAEKKIADYILNHSEEVVHLSAAQLAEKSSVAVSAVIRCCKSLGFLGYTELKMSLVAQLAKNRELNFVPYISPDDSPSEILDKIFSANVKTLHDTAEKIDRTALTNAVDMIYGAGAVYIYAIGTSSGIANDFCYRIMQMGFTAFCFTDVPSMKISTMNIKSGDVAIGISHSGRSIATIDALSLSHGMGASTLCITSCAGSPITDICDLSIAVYSDEIQYPMEAVSSRIAHISVLDAITVALSSKNYDEAQKRSKLTHDLINTLRYKGDKK